MGADSRQADENPSGPGRGTRHHRRSSARSLVLPVILGATIGLAGCSGADERPRAAGTTPTTVAAEASNTGSGSAAASSGTSGRSAGGPRQVSTGSDTLPFVADTKPDISNEIEGSPVLVSVAKGRHDGYVRYVFRFDHSDPEGHQPWRQFARPAWDVRYVPQDEAVFDGSGDPVANAGAAAHLRISFAANMHDEAGGSTLQTSIGDQDELVFGGDYEGSVRWFYGSDRQRPFRALYAGDGRVVVDIVD